jgi:RNA polymerase sigma factor (sigma-70 family)
MTAPDIQLLREYANARSEQAFAALVERHLGLVFSAAWRHVRSRELAEEIAQSVFIDLARDAKNLRETSVIPAWLYEVTRRKSVDVIRRESRRQARERAAINEDTTMDQENAEWREMEPLLDEAMEQLERKDKTAILLRFFENRGLREVGAALGISEDAAQKRVTRAIERLGAALSARGLPVTGTALAAVLSTHSAQAAPAGLIAAISTHAVVAGIAPHLNIAAAITKALTMKAIHKAVITVVITGAVGTGVYEARRAARLENQLQTLTIKDPPAASSVPALETELDAAVKRIAALQRENDQLRQTAAEVMKLRAEVTRLSSENRERKPVEAFAETAMEWKRKEAKLRRLMDQRPEQRVPEMDLIDDRTWLDIARDADLENEDGIRRAMSRLRHVAKNTFAPKLSEALLLYLKEHDGQLPGQLTELKPYFKTPVTDGMLDQYQLAHSGKFADVPEGEYPVVEKNVVDSDHDRFWKVSPNGYSTDSPQVHHNSAAMNQVIRAYRAVHGNRAPASPSDLLPFATTAEQKKAFRVLIERAHE